MKIGILGSGGIGGSLGRLWTAAGHEVMFASRHPENLVSLKIKAGANAQIGSLAEAAEFGEVILEAVPFCAVPTMPVGKLKGKTVLSASNYYPSRDGNIDLKGKSQSEWVAEHLPEARIVKAFNMMEAGVMELLADGQGREGLAIMIAGDDEAAKLIAKQLVVDAKFQAVDLGVLAQGRVFQAPDAPLYDVQLTPDEVYVHLKRQENNS